MTPDDTNTTAPAIYRISSENPPQFPCWLEHFSYGWKHHTREWPEVTVEQIIRSGFISWSKACPLNVPPADTPPAPTPALPENEERMTEAETAMAIIANLSALPVLNPTRLAPVLARLKDMEVALANADEEVNAQWRARREAVARAEAAERERDELRAWKASALAVESEWDAQAVAKLLGCPLGASVRAFIGQAVAELVAERDALRADNHRLDAEIGVLEGQLAAAQEDKRLLDSREILLNTDGVRVHHRGLNLRSAIAAGIKEGGAS